MTDVSGTADDLVVSRNGNNIRIFDVTKTLVAGAGVTQINTNIVEVPLASVPGNMQLNTLAGADTVTLNFGGGNPIPAGGVIYAGGAPTGFPGDKLNLRTGRSFSPTTSLPTAQTGKSSSIPMEAAALPLR